MGCCLLPLGLFGFLLYFALNRLRVPHRPVQWGLLASGVFVSSAFGFTTPRVALVEFIDHGWCFERVTTQALSPDRKYAAAAVWEGCGGAAGSVHSYVLVWNTERQFGSRDGTYVLYHWHEAKTEPILRWQDGKTLEITHDYGNYGPLDPFPDTVREVVSVVYRDVSSGDVLKVIPGSVPSFRSVDSSWLWVAFCVVLGYGWAVWFGLLRDLPFQWRYLSVFSLAAPWLAVAFVAIFILPRFVPTVPLVACYVLGVAIYGYGLQAAMRRNPRWALPSWSHTRTLPRT